VTSTSFVPVLWLATTPVTLGGAPYNELTREQTIDKRRSLVFMFLLFGFWFEAGKPLKSVLKMWIWNYGDRGLTG
jgi:hypothetical protein